MSDGGRIGGADRRTLRSMVDDGNPLGDFIRARRDRLRPDDAALRDDAPRRVPGLRREELAQLAGVSTNYLVRLEQGRDRHPSPSVLDALAAALQLDDAATAHLHAARPSRVRTPPGADASGGGAGLTERRASARAVGGPAGHPQRPLGRRPRRPRRWLSRCLPCFAPGAQRRRATRSSTRRCATSSATTGTAWPAASSPACGRSAPTETAGDPRLDRAWSASCRSRARSFRRLWARHDVRPRVGSGTSRAVPPAGRPRRADAGTSSP